jgi:hypothetical protein
VGREGAQRETARVVAARPIDPLLGPGGHRHRRHAHRP